MSHPLIEQNDRLVQQGIALLRSLPRDLYGAEQGAGSEAPAIGPHFRHCIDFYLCFLAGLESGVVDYDSRSRARDVEEDPRRAVEALEAVAEHLEGVSPSSLAEPVELQREAAGGEGDLLASTVGRELQFLASHTVHHYAIVALSLRLDGHSVPSGFGVAPSTLEHWRSQGRVAS